MRIRIIAADAGCKIPKALVTAVRKAFAQADVLVGDAALAASPTAWDDALVLVHGDQPMSVPVRTFVEDFVRARQRQARDGSTLDAAIVVPVTTEPGPPLPPAPLQELLSAVPDGNRTFAPAIRSLQVHLGLARRSGDHVFVSYRRSDGARFAKAVYERLKKRRFVPFLDIAEDDVAGDSIQQKITEHIRQAKAVVLLDTPDVASSRWIRFEVELALSQLMPILPVAFGPAGRTSFLGLDLLRRKVPVMRDGKLSRAPDPREVDAVVDTLEELLLHEYRRTAALSGRARAVYEGQGWSWAQRPDAQRFFEASRTAIGVARQRALNHCAIQDPRHGPTIDALVRMSAEDGGVTHRVLIYGDQPLTKEQHENLRQHQPASEQLTIAHIGEMQTLVGSNFTTLRQP